MAFNTVWHERMESRQAEIGPAQPTGELLYIGHNPAAVDDDADATLALLQTAPIVYPGVQYVQLTLQKVNVKNIGGGTWEGTAHYSRKETLFTFTTGGGTQKITNALAVRGTYTAGSGTSVTVSCKLTSGQVNVEWLENDPANITGIVGMTATGPGIPVGATVASTDENGVSLSVAATKTTGDPVSIICDVTKGSNQLVLYPAPINLLADLQSGNPNITIDNSSGDTSDVKVGASVSGAGIPANTTVSAIVNDVTFTLSNAPTITSPSVYLTFGGPIDSSVLEFGQSVNGPGIPAGTTVQSIQSATLITMSATATASSGLLSGATIVFGEPNLVTFSSAVPPPDYKGTLNAKQDSVEGIEVGVPSFEWEETFHFQPATVPPGYFRTLALMRDAVSTDSFRGFDPGEVKSRFVRGQQKGVEDLEITFCMAASFNRSNFMVGDILVPFKGGWEYMDIHYQDALDTNANVLVKKPYAVTINQVFYLQPMSQLGIGN